MRKYVALFFTVLAVFIAFSMRADFLISGGFWKYRGTLDNNFNQIPPASGLNVSVSGDLYLTDLYTADLGVGFNVMLNPVVGAYLPSVYMGIPVNIGFSNIGSFFFAPYIGYSFYDNTWDTYVSLKLHYYLNMLGSVFPVGMNVSFGVLKFDNSGYLKWLPWINIGIDAGILAEIAELKRIVVGDKVIFTPKSSEQTLKDVRFVGNIPKENRYTMVFSTEAASGTICLYKDGKSWKIKLTELHKVRNDKPFNIKITGLHLVSNKDIGFQGDISYVEKIDNIVGLQDINIDVSDAEGIQVFWDSKQVEKLITLHPKLTWKCINGESETYSDTIKQVLIDGKKFYSGVLSYGYHEVEFILSRGFVYKDKILVLPDVKHLTYEFSAYATNTISEYISLKKLYDDNKRNFESFDIEIEAESTNVSVHNNEIKIFNPIKAGRYLYELKDVKCKLFYKNSLVYEGKTSLDIILHVRPNLSEIKISPVKILADDGGKTQACDVSVKDIYMNNIDFEKISVTTVSGNEVIIKDNGECISYIKRAGVYEEFKEMELEIGNTTVRPKHFILSIEVLPDYSTYKFRKAPSFRLYAGGMYTSSLSIPFEVVDRFGNLDRIIALSGIFEKGNGEVELKNEEIIINAKNVTKSGRYFVEVSKFASKAFPKGKYINTGIGFYVDVIPDFKKSVIKVIPYDISPYRMRAAEREEVKVNAVKAEDIYGNDFEVLMLKARPEEINEAIIWFDGKALRLNDMTRAGRYEKWYIENMKVKYLDYEESLNGVGTVDLRFKLDITPATPVKVFIRGKNFYKGELYVPTEKERAILTVECMEDKFGNRIYDVGDSVIVDEKDGNLLDIYTTDGKVAVNGTGKVGSTYISFEYKDRELEIYVNKEKLFAWKLRVNVFSIPSMVKVLSFEKRINYIKDLVLEITDKHCNAVNNIPVKVDGKKYIVSQGKVVVPYIKVGFVNESEIRVSSDFERYGYRISYNDLIDVKGVGTADFIPRDLYDVKPISTMEDENNKQKYPKVSSDGRYVAYMELGENDLYMKIYDTATGEIIKVGKARYSSSRRGGEAEKGFYDYTWHPIYDWLILSKFYKDRYILVAFNPETKVMKTLYSTKGENNISASFDDSGDYVVWSGNGKLILGRVTASKDNIHLRVEKILVSNGTNIFPVMSHNGKYVVYARDNRVFLYDIEKSEETEIDSNPVDSEKDFSWSPDDSKIAFLKVGIGSSDVGKLVVYDLNTGNEKVLMKKVESGYGAPLWIRSDDGWWLMTYLPAGEANVNERLKVVNVDNPVNVRTVSVGSYDDEDIVQIGWVNIFSYVKDDDLRYGMVFHGFTYKFYTFIGCIRR